MKMDGLVKAALRVLSRAEIDLRKNYRTARKISAISNPRIISPQLSKKYTMLDHAVKVNGRSVPVRVFMPKKRVSPDVMLFFHGGGWVTGSIDQYTETCAELAGVLNRPVISVDYSLAPENPFPAGLEDCYAVTREIFRNASLADAEPDDVILIGDSAGGNLAAAVSLMARDKSEFSVKRQILIYPAVNNDYSENSRFESVRENGHDYILTIKKLREYVDLYITNENDRNNPYFAPLLAENFENNPKTLIITCELDPLRDEGEEYGKVLRDAGNYVEIYRMENAIHGFMNMAMQQRDVNIAHGIILSFLKRTGKNK